MTAPTAADLSFEPRLKIDRAKHHIRDLATKINTFMADRPFKFIIKHKPKTRTYTLVSKREKPIPRELALIAGDAIHNLCAALDITMYGLAADKATSPFELMFPFVRKAEGLEARIKSTQVHFAGTYVVETIRELKPYPGGNEILSGLHRLDNRDKHRLLILTGQAADVDRRFLMALFPNTEVAKILTPSQVARFIHTDAEETVIVEGEGATYEPLFADDFDEETKLQPPFQMVFSGGQPFEQQAIVPILNLCADRVEKAVDRLVTAFLDPRNVR